MTNDSHTPVALVLAGTRGLGLACAKRLVVDGNPVAICGRQEGSVRSAEQTLAAYGSALGMVADVSDTESLRQMVAKIQSTYGPIGKLVANAGGPPPGSFEGLTSDGWETAYELTLMSVVRAVREVIPGMRKLGSGRIVVIGSSSVRRPIPNLTLSNTFRPALNGLIKDLSISLASDQVTVNMVAPGRIDTERVRGLDRAAAERHECSVDEIERDSKRKIPAGRYGRTEEFAAAVGFLASDDASYITGQTILVDGGMTASLP